MSGKNNLFHKGLFCGLFISLSLLSLSPQTKAADSKKKLPTPLGLSNGECVSAKYAIGPADADLKSMQTDFGCNMALLEDYGKGISLTQFGYMGEEAPAVGFVTQVDPKKSSPSRAYATVTDLIVKQRRIAAEAGWCVAEVKMPDLPKDKPKPKLQIPQWLMSCVAWGTASPSQGQKSAEKLLALVNFKGTVPLPLPEAPKPQPSQP